ncbi:MAG: ABC transporter substrate-binding protein [Litoreibacter sp.]|nr:ABC transporter substrate-binding protein [Litoreibacter sp.]MCY4333541.1 ABC transporter substrate-binding protein [Litoreibacter sp.]
MLNRRQFTASLAASTLALSTAPSFALSGGQAEQLVQSAVNDINKIIGSGKSQNAMIRDFERVFNRYADVYFIALVTLGPARRTASKAEVDAYVAAFRGYFTRKYGKRFNEFVGGEIKINGSKKVKRDIQVNTTAQLRGQSPFSVTWLVSDRSGSAKISNIIIEGINTLTSERTEIGAMLDRRGGSVARLTEHLRKLS